MSIKSNKIIILTPTFNRAYTLPKLYKSLKTQTVKNFIWIIVDDGSTDNTYSYVKEIMEQSKIDIVYVYQENGGKARALNKGFSYCEGAQLVMIVDSDDYLLPTAVATVSNYLNKYKNNNKIGGFFFHYKTPNGQVIKPKGKLLNKDITLTPYEYYKYFGKYDGCHCYLNRSITRYKYPEFKDEIYVGPSVLQLKMSDTYKIVYSPEMVGVANYRDDGLTKSGRQLRLKNPNGMIYYSKLMMDPKADILTQIKYSISIWPYAKLAEKSYKDILKMVKRPVLLFITYLPGQILYLYWKKKYIN